MIIVALLMMAMAIMGALATLLYVITALGFWASLFVCLILVCCVLMFFAGMTIGDAA